MAAPDRRNDNVNAPAWGDSMTDQAYPDALPPHFRMHWYTLERVLGQGGFGITYLARDTNLDQLVAIKEYLPVEVAARRQDGAVQSRGNGQRERYRWGLERFIQEARTLARFDHPNIVRVHSVFEFNGTAYMVMRFEEGENFGSLLERRGTLPEKDVLRILLPVLDGLELVHNAGFIHRDIKPDNIHIRADGSPVLLDFGSARHALGKARTLTILVAPGYAPFEQYHSSSENQGPWTDIYGLSATCYRAIAGAPPLDAITRSKGILGSTREVLVPAVAVGSGRYSGQLLAAIDHALAFAEKDRPQSIAEWRRELRGETMASGMAMAQPGKTELAPPRSDGMSAGALAMAASPDAPPRPGDSVIRSQWPMAPIAWAIAGAAAGAIAIAVFLQYTKPDPDQKLVLQQQEKQLEQERRSLDEERKKEEARRRQEAQEAEKKRLTLEAAEKQRQMQDAEKKLLTQEAERQRREQEVERRRLAQEAERKRLAQEAEKKRLALEAEKRRQADRERQEAIEKADPSAPARPGAQDLLNKATDAEARGEFSSAVQILTPLATAGNAVAQTRLADLYASGRGVPVNNFQSYIWYSLAVRCGNAAAAAGQAGVARKLQQPQIDQAERVAAGMKICK